ncbi:MAG: hypothetical protein K0S86_1533 [Geminicoccaceae bacterium]|nr:hypothetical protein [Geminicoccaceae bacterium]
MAEAGEQSRGPRVRVRIECHLASRSAMPRRLLVYFIAPAIGAGFGPRHAAFAQYCIGATSYVVRDGDGSGDGLHSYAAAHPEHQRRASALADGRGQGRATALRARGDQAERSRRRWREACRGHYDDRAIRARHEPTRVRAIRLAHRMRRARAWMPRWGRLRTLPARRRLSISGRSSSWPCIGARGRTR